MKVSAPHRGWDLRSGYALPSSHPLCGKDSKPGRTPLIVRGNLSRRPGPALSPSVVAGFGEGFDHENRIETFASRLKRSVLHRAHRSEDKCDAGLLWRICVPWTCGSSMICSKTRKNPDTCWSLAT